MWFKTNKLAVNSSICNVLTINHTLSKAPPTLNGTLNNTVFHQINTVTYLGVIINFKFNFAIRIKTLAYRIFKAVGIMFKLKQ